MILDIKWEFPANGHGEAKLMVQVPEHDWRDEDEDTLRTRGRTIWEEVRVEVGSNKGIDK